MSVIFPSHKVSLTLLSVILILFIPLSSCYYDTEEELYPVDQSATCNTDNVTYSQTIKPILNAQCNSCHSTQAASGNVILDTYAGTSAVAANGQLGGSVNWTGTYSRMPKGGNQLPYCDLKKINKWIAVSYPNN